MSSLCLIISVVGAVLSVFLRYFLDTSFQIIEEICRYSIIYGAFLYLGPLIKTNEHLKMSILSDYMKGKVKHVNDLFISMILFASFIFLLWSAIIWVNSLLVMEMKTVSGSMLLFIPTLAIPIGMFLGCIYALQQMILEFHILRHYKDIKDNAVEEVIGGEPQNQLF